MWNNSLSLSSHTDNIVGLCLFFTLVVNGSLSTVPSSFMVPNKVVRYHFHIAPCKLWFVGWWVVSVVGFRREMDRGEIFVCGWTWSFVLHKVNAQAQVLPLYFRWLVYFGTMKIRWGKRRINIYYKTNIMSLYYVRTVCASVRCKVGCWTEYTCWVDFVEYL